MTASYVEWFADTLSDKSCLQPEITRGINGKLKWPHETQLIVEISLKNAEKVEWFLDDRPLKSCEELFRDGRLLKGGGDGVQIIDSLSSSGEWLSRLVLPAALQKNCGRVSLSLLTVRATNKLGNSCESSARILPTEVPTTAKSSRIKTNGIDIQNGHQQMEKERQKHTAERQQPNMQGSFEVLDSGKAFSPSVTPNPKNCRTSVAQIHRKAMAQIQVEPAEVPMPSCQMKMMDKRSNAVGGTPNSDNDAHCDLCPFVSPKGKRGLNIHKTMKHFACVKCGHRAESADARKIHREQCGRKSLSAKNDQNPPEEKPNKRRESEPSKRLTLKSLNEHLEEFEGRQNGENERLERKIDNLGRKFGRANLKGENKEEKTEEFLSEDEEQ
ncbi:hypothetical protein niasHT_004763 [Heterodera trifolii]|uniref:Uncharacterized protein n=1 Tax=Heterodera trifolii TaxID=157864 RepID=A0ABD2M9M7_9BILA